MDLPHKKIILLVLAHENEDYNKFKSVWLKYINKFENDVKVYFVYGNSTFDLNSNHDLVFHNIQENYKDGLILKTVEALEYINKNWNYDYVVRTNISSFWDLNNLLLYTDSFSKENFYGGPLRTKFPSFIRGEAIIFSRDVSLKVCENKKLLNLEHAEDRSFFNLVSKNLNIIPTDLIKKTVYIVDEISSNFNTEEISYKIDHLSKEKDKPYHYRIKHIKHTYRNRFNVDVSIMKYLCNKIYGIE